MKALKIIIAVLVALALALVTAIFIVRFIQDDDEPDTASSSSFTSDEQASAPEGFDEEDFLDYATGLGIYINTPMDSTEELRTGAAPFAPLFTAWVHVNIMGGSSYPLPYEELDFASQELFGITFNRDFDAVGSFEEDGFWTPEIGFEYLYFEADPETLSFNVDTITVEGRAATRIHLFAEEINNIRHLRYTYAYRPEQTLVPYQLVRIEYLGDIPSKFDLDEEDFIAYLSTFSSYVNTPIQTADDLKDSTSARLFTANYWIDTENPGSAVCPYEEFDQTAYKIFGFKFERKTGYDPEVAEWTEDGYRPFEMDYGNPRTVVYGETIVQNYYSVSAQVGVGYWDFNNEELVLDRTLLYTFYYNPDQSLTSYRLESIKLLEEYRK